jgi:MFS family permease
VRIHPDSSVFTLLLGPLSSLPTFGIDMILPSLSATGADLGAAPADVGLAMSVYLLSLGATLPVYGPVSDRFCRKPIVVFGCALVIIASSYLRVRIMTHPTSRLGFSAIMVMQFCGVVPANGFHVDIDVTSCRGAVVHVIGVLVHIKHQNRTTSCERCRMVGRPLVNEALVAG